MCGGKKIKNIGSVSVTVFCLSVFNIVSMSLVTCQNGLLFLVFSRLFVVVRSSFTLAANGLQLQEVGDFEAQNCLPPLNLIRSTKLHLTTEPPISCRCCYTLFLFSYQVVNVILKYKLSMIL